MRCGIAGAVVIAALAVAGCGDDGGTESAEAPEAATQGAKVIDPAVADGASGTVTYCTGKDTSGAQKASVRAFNERFADEDLKARLLEFPESADQQRSQFIQRQRAESGECDIFYADVIWTAEFASQEWLYDLTPVRRGARRRVHPVHARDAQYEDRY